jgi:xylan 1,4-beta-xylosidase
VLQKTGHADLVETDDGWFMVHLCARPLTPHGRCVLGRETAIQQVVWEDGWPRLATQLPEERVTTLVQSDVYDDRGCHRDHFDQPQIGIHYQTLRVPMCASIFDLEKHESHLRIYGGEAFSSLHEQSLLARRVQAFSYRIETSLEFSPDSSRDMAGLVLYYNTENYVYLCVTRNRSDKECIQVFQCNRNELHAPLEDGIMILKASKVHLRMDVQRERGACFYSLDGEQWESVVADFPADYLSDDYIAGRAFTGTFAGICCQALGAERIFADFDYFDYEETEAE